MQRSVKLLLFSGKTIEPVRFFVREVGVLLFTICFYTRIPMIIPIHYTIYLITRMDLEVKVVLGANRNALILEM